MVNKMSIDKKILEELKRYNEINSYLFEQELPPPPAGDAEIDLGIDVEGATPPPAGETPPTTETPMTGVTTPPSPPVDVENDPDVEKVGDEKEKREELEITDLVNSQKSVEEKQDEYFENLFTHLTDLEGKLSAMDGIIDRLNNIESKIEKYRIKTPEEKLELRTLDSGPFNQKLSQFFEDKEEEMEMTGKNEYVLTPDEVESYSPNEIKRSFRNFGEDEMTPEDDMSRFKKIY
jgi:hypothetical protein